MSKSKITTIILIFILGLVILTVINVVGRSKVTNLIGSSFQQNIKQKTQQQSSPTSETPSYNPPKETHYNRATDLKTELDSIDPKVLDSDFKDLQNLTDGLKSL